MICRVNSRRVICSGFVAIILLLSGCANVARFMGEQTAQDEQASAATPTAQNAVQGSELDEQGALSPPPFSQENPQALEAEQAIQSQLSLINAPNRFMQTKRSNSGQTKVNIVNALAAYQSAQYDQALNYAKQAMASPEPLNSGAYVLIGDIHIALARQSQNKASTDVAGQHQQLALQSFDNALSLNPDNYKAANRRAMLHREQGQFDQALALYNQAIKAYPGHALSYRNRGVLLDLYMGDKAAALADYQRYIALLEFQLAYQQTAPTNQAMESVVFIQPSVVEAFFQGDDLARELRQVKGWQLDMQRQLKATESANMVHRRDAQPRHSDMNSHSQGPDAVLVAHNGEENEQ